MKSSRETMPLPRRPTPRMALVRQRLPSDKVPDPRAAVRQQLLDWGIGDRAPPGSRIAITAGSRGIGGFVPLLQGIVDSLRLGRAEPFIVPAMGSHGGATPEGQVEILRRLGVTEAVVGAPVRATMDTVDLGR